MNPPPAPDPPAPPPPAVCEECDGYGYVVPPDGPDEGVKVPCPRCGGYGLQGSGGRGLPPGNRG